MKLTKYGHACLVIEAGGESIVIDPGNLTPDFKVPQNTIAAVITHAHGDHLDERQLQKITDANGDAIIVAHKSIIDTLNPHHSIEAEPSQSLAVGPFQLRFYGGQHAVIHSSIAPIPNLGVMVNDLLYYPGDSFAIPDRPVKYLALPVGAPWLKLGEAIDFLNKIKPMVAFPVHDAVLSGSGKAIVDHLLTTFTKGTNTDYRRLTTKPLNIIG